MSIASIETVRPAGQASAAGPAPVIDVRSAGFVADGRVVLHAVSMQAGRGQMIGLIGHNGSGKSSLIKLLARQQAPGSGEILLHGRPLSAWGAREFAQQVAYLPQYTPQNLDMTVSELVALGRYPWHGALGRFGPDDRARVQDAMRLPDVERFADHMVDTLSGGERQRAWVAALIAQDAGCLLLDEPTSALDIAHQVSVLQLLRDLTDSEQLTVIVILHDVNLAARFCDQMIALHDGRVLAAGCPDALMREDVLESIYGILMGVFRHPESGALISFAR